MARDAEVVHEYGTEQEEFWAGTFGSKYSARNSPDRFLPSNLAFFSRVLRSRKPVDSIIEFGANIGLNLIALRQLLPTAELSAVEINSTAAEELEKIDGLTVHTASLLEFEIDRAWDLSLVKGVLIHIAPDQLPTAYRRLYEASRRYICIAEYYNTDPVEISYRGHRNRMFKRDFAGEMLDLFPDLTIVDYGFTYHRDPNFEHDDINWFLLEKRDG